MVKTGLIALAVLATTADASAQIRLTSGSETATISFTETDRVISIGGATPLTCTKVDGSTTCLNAQLSTLGSRLDTIEAALNTATTGVVARLAALEAVDHVAARSTLQGNIDANTVGITANHKGMKGNTDDIAALELEKGQKGASVTGAKGEAGTAGTNGKAGTNGSKGASGTNGSKGQTGAQGTHTIGKDGSKGASGTNGSKGQKGTHTVGQKGDTGTDGSKGASGTDGSKGQTGAQAQGPTALEQAEAAVAALNPYVWYKPENLIYGGNSDNSRWSDAGSCGCDMTRQQGDQGGQFPGTATTTLNGEQFSYALFDGINNCAGSRAFDAPQNTAMSMFGVFNTHNTARGWGYPWSLGDHDDTGSPGQYHNVMTMEIEGEHTFDLAYGHGADHKYTADVASSGSLWSPGFTLWQFQIANRQSPTVKRNHQQMNVGTDNSQGHTDLPERNHLSIGCVDFAGNQVGHPAQFTKVDWLDLMYFKQDLTAAQVVTVNHYYNTKYGL